jgi:8-oxo-dGTP pyrophosphatase MutT (NUDIX family)
MKTKPRLQYAALPFRLLDDGFPEVMLLTSRENRRWIIPKGWPKKGLAGHAVAVREAREEGGLVGRIGKRTVGSYHYAKQLSADEAVLCRVRIFPLEVKRQLDDWPEKGERDTCWLTPGEAAHLVDDPGLRKVLQGTAKLLRRYGNRRR